MELMRAFKTLIRKGKSRRFVFLIDGLDEFSGDHGELITLIHEIASADNVKMCVASRPWPVFEEAFDHSPSLLLEDLTYHDMVQYITQKLHSNKGFKNLRNEEPEYASDLADRIAQKASGVFLWVTLVISSLLAGLTNGDRITDLQERLDALPPDLEDLFEKIFDSIEPLYKKQASQLFQLIRTTKRPLTLLNLSYAEEEPVTCIKQPIAQASYDQMESKAERMRRRLNSRCKGLLEVISPQKRRKSQQTLANSTVQYLHRTVKDFMERQDIGEKIAVGAGASYEPYLQLTNGLLGTMKATNVLTGLEFWKYIFFTSEYADFSAMSLLVEKHVLVQLLDELHRTALSHLQHHPIPGIELSGSYSSKSLPHAQGARIVNYYVNDFLNFAVQCQLQWYVEVKLEDADALSYPQRYPPLFCAVLDYDFTYYATQSSLEPLPSIFRKDPSPQIIKALLEAGANPNQPVKLQSRTRTPWQVVMDRVTSLNRIQQPVWAKIAGLFLDYGADLSVKGAVDVQLKLRPEVVTEMKKVAKETEKTSWLLAAVKRTFSKKSGGTERPTS